MTKQFLMKFVSGAALAASITGCAGEPEVDVTAEEIIGGFPARSAALDAIGALGYNLGDGTFAPVCTGTLITPTVVLTAEHCVDWVFDPANELAFLIGWDANAPKRVVPVRGVAMEQSFWGGLLGLGSDVAVMHLAEPVTDVTPLPYAEMTADLVGQRLAGIGYGQQDSLGTAGTRMAGSMELQQLGGPLFEAIFGSFEAFLADGQVFHNGLDPANPDDAIVLQQYYDETLLLDVEAWLGNGAGDAQGCFGDSGGPIVAQRDGQTTVLGVASFVAYADALCEYGTGYARLEPIALDFIDYELNCPLIPREGMCEGTEAVRCATPEEGGYRPLRTDCATFGMECGIDELGELGCVEPGTGGGGTCTHDTCTVGDALDPSCGSCEADICAVDPFCCEVQWDSLCVQQVETVCGGSCEAAPEAPEAPVVAPEIAIDPAVQVKSAGH